MPCKHSGAGPPGRLSGGVPIAAYALVLTVMRISLLAWRREPEAHKIVINAVTVLEVAQRFFWILYLGDFSVKLVLVTRVGPETNSRCAAASR